MRPSFPSRHGAGPVGESPRRTRAGPRKARSDGRRQARTTGGGVPARRRVNPEGPRRIKVGFPHRDKGGPVGVIVTEEYVCDYCTKPIAHSDVIVGKLSLRKR